MSAADRLRVFAGDTTQSGGTRSLAVRAWWELTGRCEPGPWTGAVRELGGDSTDEQVVEALRAYCAVLAQRPAGPDDLPKLLARIRDDGGAS